MRSPCFGITLAFLLAGCTAAPGPGAWQPEPEEAKVALQRVQSCINRAHGLTTGERIVLTLGSAKSRTAHALAHGGALAAFMVMGQRDAVGFWNVRALREREGNAHPRAEAGCAFYVRRFEDLDEIAAHGVDLAASLVDCMGDPELVHLLTVIEGSRSSVGPGACE